MLNLKSYISLTQVQGWYSCKIDIFYGLFLRDNRMINIYNKNHCSEVKSVWKLALDSKMEFQALKNYYVSIISNWPQEKIIELFEIAIITIRNLNNCESVKIINNCENTEVLYKSFGAKTCSLPFESTREANNCESTEVLYKSFGSIFCPLPFRAE